MIRSSEVSTSDSIFDRKNSKESRNLTTIFHRTKKPVSKVCSYLPLSAENLELFSSQALLSVEISWISDAVQF